MSGRAPGGLGEPPHLGEAARDERRLCVVAEREAVRCRRRRGRSTFFAAAQSSTPTTSSVHVDAEDRGVNGELEPHGELEVVARDHGRGREPADDLVGDVGAGEDGDRAALDERRESRAGRRVEPLREAQDGCVPGKARDDLAEDPARDGEDDELGVRDRRIA